MWWSRKVCTETLVGQGRVVVLSGYAQYNKHTHTTCCIIFGFNWIIICLLSEYYCGGFTIIIITSLFISAQWGSELCPDFNIAISSKYMGLKIARALYGNIGEERDIFLETTSPGWFSG